MKRFLTLVTLVLILAACSAERAEQPAGALTPASAQGPVTTTGPATVETNRAIPASPTAPEVAADPTDAPQPIAATETVTTEQDPTALPEATAETVPAEAAVTVNGRTEDGAYFLGNADAPVTIIDYSDFL